MVNEAKTENLVRGLLSANGYYQNPELIVEEKKSDNPAISLLLKNASKKGKGAGYPEFIIRSKQVGNFLIVIECKASVLKHASDTLDNYADYAVDGVLLYAAHMSKQYDVLAIAVSGEDASSMKVSQYLVLQKAAKQPFLGDQILSFDDYYKAYSQSPQKYNQDLKSLAKYFKKLNAKLFAKKVMEVQRSLLISGILIALKNNAFRKGYKGHTEAQHLVDNLVQTISDELVDAKLPEKRIANLKQAFSFITTHTTLSTDKEFLENLIDEIDRTLNAFMKTYQYYDAIGQFYIEFLRYANNDKTLGIVLTPPHITELFSDLAGVTKNSLIIDNCCGTAGFLVSAMRKMIGEAQGNSKEVKKILNERLIGIEFQDIVYALAVSNMIVHDDGKTNIFPGDCFGMVDFIKANFSPTVGLLNPPYKPPDQTEEEVKEELEFVANNLDMLASNGKCVAIVPMSCVLAQDGHGLALKENLLKSHTLEAVMSMPDQLFHDSDSAVVTAVMVFTAHAPHPQGKKTWFAYWKDDKFVLVKNRGRIDKFNKWPETRDYWVNTFRNREVISGYSLMKNVKAEDEWCIESYMETDYSKLTQTDFVDVIKKFVAHQFSEGK